MRTRIGRTGALTAGALVALAMAAPVVRADEDACATHRYDTTVEWHESGQMAARMAKEKAKLVYALHLSGELPDAGLT